MNCEKCGKELSYVEVNTFNLDGTDSDIGVSFKEVDCDTVVLEVNKNWTGYDLENDERLETIKCPHCGEFPFVNNEIQEYDIVRLVMFKTRKKQKKLISMSDIEKALDKACSKLATVIDIEGCNGFCEHGLEGCGKDYDCYSKDWWKEWCMKDE